MKLTGRQREILEGLASDDGELDLVECHGAWWFGLSRTNAATGLFFLRRMLIKPIEKWDDAYCSYEITKWGRRALTEPDFDWESCLRSNTGET